LPLVGEQESRRVYLEQRVENRLQIPTNRGNTTKSTVSHSVAGYWKTITRHSRLLSVEAAFAKVSEAHITSVIVSID